MNFKTLVSTALLVIILLASCNRGNASQQEQASPTDTDTTVAAQVTPDGKTTYRPDTARVLHEQGWDKDSPFVMISKRELRLKVYGTIGGDTTLLAQYPVCLARNLGPKQKSGDNRTPECTMQHPFHIIQVQDASTWHHDFGDGRGSILSYGHWFLRLQTPFKGIGIHGSTNNEDKLPGRDSEGCIRMRNNDLDHFKQTYARVGMPVVIKGEQEGNYPFEDKAAR